MVPLRRDEWSGAENTGAGHVQAWRNGEQTRAAYCEQHDLSDGAMGYRVRKLRHERDGGDDAADGAARGQLQNDATVQTFNEVSREMGHGPLGIRSPREVGT